MTKMEVRRLTNAEKATKKRAKVSTKVLSTDQGTMRVRLIDANSETFGRDFLQVFRLNVRDARKENKERLGAADCVSRVS